MIWWQRQRSQELAGVNAFWKHLRLLECVQNTAHCKADRHGVEITLYSTSLKPEQKMPRLRWRIQCVTHLSIHQVLAISKIPNIPRMPVGKCQTVWLSTNMSLSFMVQNSTLSGNPSSFSYIWTVWNSFFLHRFTFFFRSKLAFL